MSRKGCGTNSICNQPNKGREARDALFRRFCLLNGKRQLSSLELPVAAGPLSTIFRHGGSRPKSVIQHPAQLPGSGRLSSLRGEVGTRDLLIQCDRYQVSQKPVFNLPNSPEQCSYCAIGERGQGPWKLKLNKVGRPSCHLSTAATPE